MDASSLRKFLSPPVLLALFLLDFFLAVGLLVLHDGQPRSLLGVAILTMGILGIAIANGLGVRVKQANDALGEGERYIESVAELSQDIHAIVDARSRECLYVSPAVMNLLGFDTARFLSGGLDSLLERVHPMDRAMVRQQWERIMDPAGRAPVALAPEAVQEQVYRIQHASEAWRWFRDRRMVFERSLDGSPSEILVVVSDVTETRDREAALVQARKQESLGALARGTVHDLNNILMGIQGLCEIALDKDTPEGSAAETLQHVQEDTVRASVLCQQMLSYSGQGRLQILRHQLNDSIRDSLPLLESLLPEGGQLELELEPDLPLVNADPSRIRYVLLNLVFNGVESLGGRGGSIRLRTQLRRLLDADGLPGLEGDFVALEVMDSGLGLPPQALQQILDPFFSTHFPGMGLGLFAVQGILREHHGGLQVQAATEGGVLPTLYFPLAAKETVVDASDEGTPTTAPIGAILLVDDEPTIRSILRQGFEHAGFKVIEAVDGVDGFGAFVRHRSSISAVLLDLTMPRMNGDEVFKEIRKIAPEIPVVLMSGYSKQDATAQLEGQGLAGFIHKPCSIKEALAVLAKALAPKDAP